MSLNLERKYSRRFQPGQGKQNLALGIPSFQLQAEDKSTTMRWAVAAALVFHLVLFLVTFPSYERTLEVSAPTQKAFVIQQVRFKPPEPQKAPSRPKRKVRKVPIPDPTPDLPEPLLREPTFETPEIDFADDLGDVLDYVPEAPPSAGIGGVVAIKGDVIPPKKVFAPQPGYTEEARQARVQGVVIMQAIIDIVGNVQNVRVLKGLPSGLAESAVDTVQSWKFEPATLNGEPVPVYYNFTVNFTLQ